MPKRLLCLLTFVLTMAHPFASARAEPVVEHVAIASVNSLGSKTPLTLSGDFSRPNGPGPFPAVVLLHGCGGPRPNASLWRRFFHDRGYAVLAVNSFAPRGVDEICTKTGVVTWKMRAADAFGALEHLARQPVIQPDAILVMGFSHGGGISLDVTSSFRLDARLASLPRFRAAIALYPPCGQPQRKDSRRMAPTFIGIGADDDWTPAEECKALAANHQGPDALDLRVYPNAAHSFDNLDRPVTRLTKALNRHSPTGMGATVGGSPSATAAVQEDVARFLSTALAR